MKIVICVTKSRTEAEYLIDYIEASLRIHLKRLIESYGFFTGVDVFDTIYYETKYSLRMKTLMK